MAKMDGYMSATFNKKDSTTGAGITIDYAHHELHDGDFFRVGGYIVTNLANAAIFDIRIKTPDTTKWAHSGFETITDMAAKVELYEGTTWTAKGEAMTIYNKNRNSATAATLAVYQDNPAGTRLTVNATGNLIMQDRIGSGKAEGGTAGTSTEWILKQNTEYLYRITNVAGAGTQLNGSWSLLWYEHSNN